MYLCKSDTGIKRFFLSYYSYLSCHHHMFEVIINKYSVIAVERLHLPQLVFLYQKSNYILTIYFFRSIRTGRTTIWSGRAHGVGQVLPAEVWPATVPMDYC